MSNLNTINYINTTSDENHSLKNNQIDSTGRIDEKIEKNRFNYIVKEILDQEPIATAISDNFIFIQVSEENSEYILKKKKVIKSGDSTSYSYYTPNVSLGTKIFVKSKRISDDPLEYEDYDYTYILIEIQTEPTKYIYKSLGKMFDPNETLHLYNEKSLITDGSIELLEPQLKTLNYDSTEEIYDPPLLIKDNLNNLCFFIQSGVAAALVLYDDNEYKTYNLQTLDTYGISYTKYNDYLYISNSVGLSHCYNLSNYDPSTQIYGLQTTSPAGDNIIYYMHTNENDSLYIIDDRNSKRHLEYITKELITDYTNFKVEGIKYKEIKVSTTSLSPPYGYIIINGLTIENNHYDYIFYDNSMGPQTQEKEYFVITRNNDIFVNKVVPSSSSLESIKKIKNGVYNSNQNKLYLHTYDNKILIFDVINSGSDIGKLEETNIITFSNVSKLSSTLINNEVYYLSSNKIYKLVEQNNTIEPIEIQTNLPEEFEIVDFDIINDKIFIYSNNPSIAYIYNTNPKNINLSKNETNIYNNMVITPDKVNVNKILSITSLEIPINTEEDDDDFM